LLDSACSTLRVRLAVLVEADTRREVVVVVVVAFRGFGDSTVTGGSAPGRGLVASCATAVPIDAAPTTSQDAAVDAKRVIEFLRMT
jgi:hypothetical protein